MKHPLGNFSKYGLKKRLSGKRPLKFAQKSSDLKPVYYPYASLRVYLTPDCNYDCYYCTRLAHPDARNQFDYEKMNVRDLLRGLNRFYGFYQYVLTGGEPSLLSHLPDIANGLYKANVRIVTNLYDVEILNKIEKNNVCFDITCHKDYVEFITKYKRLRGNKEVFVLNRPEMPANIVINALRSEGINAESVPFYLRKDHYKHTILCRCINVHIAPNGGIHPCHARLMQNREPLGYITDKKLDNIFDKYIKCNDYGTCAPADLIRYVRKIETI